jgi:hypothetical protein
VYLAKLDASGEPVIVAETPPAITPTNGTVAYVSQGSKDQFYMVLFLAFAIVIIFLYLMERNKHYTQHQGV